MKKNNLIALFLMLCTACFCSCSQQEKTVTFAIASDFHAQDVPDGKERLSSFVRAAQVWGIERSGFFNGREKWAKGFENQRV